MMKCPKCHSQAITFLKWMRDINAFKTTCQSCGIELKANMALYVIFVVSLISVIAVIPYFDDILFLLGFGDEYKKIELLILLPIIVLSGITAWFLGGYKVKKSE